MPNDVTQKAAVIQALAENFSTRTLSADLVSMWIKLLTPYTVEQVQAGALYLLGNYTFKTLPPFAEFKSAIERVSGKRTLTDIQADRKMQAEDAWQGVLEQISVVGSYGAPHFDPVTSSVVRGFGGWKVMCAWLEEDFHWRHKEFLERWIAADERNEREARYLECSKQNLLESPGKRACSLDDFLSRNPQHAGTGKAKALAHIVNAAG